VASISIIYQNLRHLFSNKNQFKERKFGMQLMASVFSKIIQGEIPSFKIFEDDYTFAFLDINPIQPGHTLIVPKYEVDYFVDLPEPFYTAIFKTAKIIAPALQIATQASRIGTLIEGFDVPHVHYHLVPMFQPGDLFSQRLSLDEAQMKAIQDKIISHL
jgi:histidine triad (HIT) family protein